MKVGLGLPVSAPPVLLDWARRAEAGPFSSLGLLDRLTYANPEPLVTLAVLAGATSRIRLQTEVLLGPLRATPLLAKQAATLDVLSGGRFTLGLGVGGREDDFHAAGVPLRGRGLLMDRQMAELRRLWAGQPVSAEAGPIGPAPVTPGGPEILFGGFQPAALARVGRFGDGLLAAAPPSRLGGQLELVRRSWSEAGRAGEPRIVAQTGIALGGPEVLEDSRAAMAAYYAFVGEYAQAMIEGVLTTPEQIRERIRQFEDLGVDEVILYCYARDPEQVDRVADAL